jgi:restriction endonuclease S subunit
MQVVENPKDGIRLLTPHPVCMTVTGARIQERIDPESFYSTYLHSKITKIPTKPLSVLVGFGKQRIVPQRTPDYVYDYVDLVDIDCEYGLAEARKVYGKNIKGTRNEIRESSILYSRIRPNLGRIAFFSPTKGVKTVCSPEFSVLMPYPDVNIRCILAILRTNSLVSLATQKSTGSTRPRLPESELKQLTIPQFSDSTQRSIEQLLSITQWLIINGRGLVNNVVKAFDDKIKQELLPQEKTPPTTCTMKASEFSKRIDPEYHSLIEWMSKLQKGNIQLDDLGRITDFSDETINPKNFPQQPFIYITIEAVNIKTGQIESFYEILGKDAPGRARRIISQGDILLAKTRPSRGAIALVPEYHNGDVASTGFAVMKAKENLNAEYVYAMLRTHFCRIQLKNRATGTGYPEITDDEIAQVQIPILSKEAQLEANVRIRSSLGICQVAKAIIRDTERYIQKRLNNEITDVDLTDFCFNALNSLRRMMEDIASAVETEEIQSDKQLVSDLKEALEDIEAGRFVNFTELMNKQECR